MFARYPGLLDRGVMLRFPNGPLLQLLITLVDILPMDYQGGDLDNATSEVVMDAIGYMAEGYVNYTTMSNIEMADTDLFYNELVQTAMDVRLQVPPNMVYLQYCGHTDKLVFITATQLPMQPGGYYEYS